MNTGCNSITPHPQLLEVLFACRQRSARVFNDVLGLHDVDHLAIGFVSPQQQLLILSSTPALEFNLFSRHLWRFDQSYSLTWITKQGFAGWQSLYHPACYHELFYYKQLKTHYRRGHSLAVANKHQPLVFSYASHKDTETGDISRDLGKMGYYCAQLLQPLVEPLGF
ncbi:putative FlgJ-like protein [Legionella rubrilucens]|uniref:Putative FlgJ-like protein n=1 Tax=Legionella rubrilucens TaxID=458 RepID=A0A0W0XYJ6_9GAMM|nr:hypothetical protein [Legionella rubrilucens]KTD49885.1 putative FlgJ-like protein [Legionella rubrilucens]